MPRVTVLMPTHNRADIVGHAIQSVLDQTAGDFELLVVADGCTDNTLDVVSRVADPRIRVLDLPKAPYFGYGNRNIALREARGELIAYAAHDDLLLPDHLEILTRALAAPSREWAYSRPLWVSTDGLIVPFATNLTNRDELELFLAGTNTIPMTCVIHRRCCLDKYGYWPEDMPHSADWRLWSAIIEGGARCNIAYEATPTCLHFSANWRGSRYADKSLVRKWLEIADSSHWWPSALRYEIPPAVPEQAVIADVMRAHRGSWAEEVRAAAARVLDRVAWEAVSGYGWTRVPARPRVRETSVDDLSRTAATESTDRRGGDYGRETRDV